MQFLEGEDFYPYPNWSLMLQPKFDRTEKKKPSELQTRAWSYCSSHASKAGII